MAYSEALAERIRNALKDVADASDRRMFGGVCFTVRGNMLVGVVGDELMARVGAQAYEAALARPGARPMDFTGRPMKGYVFVGSGALASDVDLSAWIDLACRYVMTLPPKSLKGAAKPSAPKGSGQKRAKKTG